MSVDKWMETMQKLPQYPLSWSYASIKKKVKPSGQCLWTVETGKLLKETASFDNRKS